MHQTLKQRMLFRLERAVFYIWNLRWYLPVLIRRDKKASLNWRIDCAAFMMQRVLDDLETRGDETAARARLYSALTMVNWS